jgi:3-isopropylmalate dehydrogenase
MMASDVHCCAQAQHGSAPDIAGQDKANPVSMILSVGMLLQWMGEHHDSQALIDAGLAMDKAVDAVLKNPGQRTPDLGGSFGTKAFGEAVAKVIQG